MSLEIRTVVAKGPSESTVSCEVPLETGMGGMRFTSVLCSGAGGSVGSNRAHQWGCSTRFRCEQNDAKIKTW